MSNYNTLRRQELKHIEESMRSDAGYKGTLTRLYNRVEKDISKDITSDLEGFAFRDGVSMTEARKIASKTDVLAYQDTAKKYVEQAEAMRRANPGRAVRYSDFSDQANRELRRYNITMRSNRLELLEAKVNLHTVALANEEEWLLQNHLAKEVLKEYERQAGILGITVPSDNQLDRMIRGVLTAQGDQTTFSDNVWQNQRELRDSINRSIERTIIRGENPRVAARSMRELVTEGFTGKHGNGGAKFAADRIAITETARVQTLVQEQAFKDAGIDKKMWIAEPDACSECEPLDGETFDVDDTSETIPKHPFCRCSFAAVVER